MPNSQVSGDGKVAVILHVKPGSLLPENLSIKDKINDHVVLVNVFASEIDALRSTNGIVSVQVSKPF